MMTLLRSTGISHNKLQSEGPSQGDGVNDNEDYHGQEEE